MGKRGDRSQWPPSLLALGPVLRRERKDVRRMSLHVLCPLVGISAGYMSQVEKGNHLPTLAVLSRWAEAFGVTVSQLLIWTETYTKEESTSG